MMNHHGKALLALLLIMLTSPFLLAGFVFRAICPAFEQGMIVYENLLIWINDNG